VKQNYVKTVGEHFYDETKGIRLMQERYPRIDPEKNRYSEFRKKMALAGEKGSQAGALTIDEWFESRDHSRPPPSDGDTVPYMPPEESAEAS
jgi:hypothetical protein